MQHSLRHYIVILTLFALSFGVGGKVYLCLSPDGDVHMAQKPSSCALVKNCSASDTAVALDHHRVKCQSHCLDIALGGDKSELPNKNTVQIPSPALMPLALSIIPTIAVQQPFHPTPSVQLPQFALQQSVILLI
jgi:hypothetical protein